MATYNTEADLANAIFKELKTELQDEPLFDEEASAKVLKQKVQEALRELKRRRCYKNTSMSAEDILEDLEEHYTTIKRAALVWFNRIGSEGESVHYENTVHRSFVYDDELFSGVIAFVKVL